MNTYSSCSSETGCERPNSACSSMLCRSYTSCRLTSVVGTVDPLAVLAQNSRVPRPPLIGRSSVPLGCGDREIPSIVGLITKIESR